MICGSQTINGVWFCGIRGPLEKIAFAQEIVTTGFDYNNLPTKFYLRIEF
jgi:hypothetical protein